MVLFSFRDKDLPLNREVRSSLRRVFGVGFSRAGWLTTRLGLGYPFFSSALNRYMITVMLGTLNSVLRSETKIRRDQETRIRLLQELGHWRGRRHSLFLPTRGQRSRSNGCTQKRLRLNKTF